MDNCVHYLNESWPWTSNVFNIPVSGIWIVTACFCFVLKESFFDEADPEEEDENPTPSRADRRRKASQQQQQQRQDDEVQESESETNDLV